MKLNFLGRVPEKMKSMAPINQGAFFFLGALHYFLMSITNARIYNCIEDIND